MKKKLGKILVGLLIVFMIPAVSMIYARMLEDFGFITPSSFGSISSFLGLTDTPSAYTGKGGYSVRVNATPDALEFSNTAWTDAEISDTITVGSSGSVDDAAIPSGITRDTEHDTWAEHPTLTENYILQGNASNQPAATNTLTVDTVNLSASSKLQVGGAQIDHDDMAGTANIATTGTIQGRGVWGSNITENIALNTTALHGLMYQVTAACTVTLDAASDAGYGATVAFYVRDASETVIIEIDGSDKINLHGTPLDAGDTIDSPGNAGDFIILVATTDADGGGTDGWITWGYGEAVWTDGGAT